MRKQAIVIGSGIAGVATTYALINKGYRVRVLEKNTRPKGASIRNFGMIWPTGQPEGEYYELAMKSRQIWLDLSEKANFQLDQNGSLHLAYQNDEQNALYEFIDAHEDQRNLKWLSYSEVVDKSPGVVSDELIGAMYSGEDMLVDPREALPKLIEWLQAQPDCSFHFNTPVLAIHDQTCISPGQTWTADKIFLCTGSDIDLLFPEVLKPGGMTCQLQMMRTGIQPDRFKLGPSLCGGLTLIHYSAFNGLPSLEILKNRMQDEHRDLLQLGIHVMAAQNQTGEVTIGDSHQYGDDPDPFIRQDINEKILNYLSGFCRLPDLNIASYWKGSYFKSTGDHPYFIEEISPYCTIINGFGGAGMTLAFALAEREISRL